VLKLFAALQPEAFGSTNPAPGPLQPHNVIDFSAYYPGRVSQRRCVPAPASTRPRAHWRIGLIGLTQLMAVPPLLFYWPDPSSGEYVTGVAEHSSILLPDGSSVALNAQSRLRVRFSASGRDVVLLKGAALFSVAHDTLRPFRVHARGAIFEAVGTDFSIYLGGGVTQIAVKQGRVKVLENLNQTPLILNPYGLVPIGTAMFEMQPEFSVGAGHEARVSARRD
jgi:ferric-dicitrate binding protein FerR (iron transport regulator)